MTAGGKGHAPRQQRDDDAFRRNWEAIFAKPVCWGLDDCSSQEYSICNHKDTCGAKEVKDERRTPNAG